MNELKKSVSRSFERKIQIVQYEPASFFASYTEEMDKDTDSETIKRISQMLYELAKSDVEQAIEDYKQANIKAEAVKRIENGGWGDKK